MSFAFPSAFFWLALAVPVVLLYILKVRLRRVTVSSNMFWQQVYDEKPPRALWQQLRHWSSLLLQLLLLVLLIVAVADPFLSGSSRSGRRLVLVIDNSASMATTDVAPSRLGSAKQDAMSLVDTLGPLDEAAVLVAGSNPEVVCGMTGHLPTLKNAIDAIAQTDASTSLEPAVRLAKKLLATARSSESRTSAGDSTRSIFVFTDGCVSSIDESLFTANQKPDTSDMTVIPRLLGTSMSNVGITQFQARRALSDPIGYEMLVAVQNASDAGIQCRLELFLNDALIDVLPLELDPGEVWSQSLAKTSADGGVLRAELSGFRKPAESTQPNAGDSDRSVPDEVQDGLTSDNRSYAILTPRPAIPVLLVTEGNVFLQKVLEATPRVELMISRSVPAELPADFSQRNGVIVIHGMVPATLPKGNVMVIDPTNDSELWTRRGFTESPLITEQDESSPLLTFVNLQNVSLPRVESLQLTNEFRAVVKTIAGDILIGTLQQSDRRYVVISMNLTESDLGFRTAFPILMSNALSWFTETSSDIQPVVNPDAVVSLPVPAEFAGDSQALVLSGPGGQSRAIFVRVPEPDEQPSSGTKETRTVQVGPFGSAGLWSIQRSTLDDRRINIAVNLADARESDLRRAKSLAELSSNSIGQQPAGFRRPIWMTLVTMACLLTCVEWMLYHRRVIE